MPTPPPAEIRRELAAQIEVVLQAGLQVWHLNGHLNLHLHPRIFPVVADLAREYGIPAVRLAREDWRTTLALAPDSPLPKIAQGLILRGFAAGPRESPGARDWSLMTISSGSPTTGG